MDIITPRSSRRAFFGMLAFGAAAFNARGAFAEELELRRASRRGRTTRPTPARHRQRPPDHQRRDHPGGGRGHAPERADPRHQGRPDPQCRRRDLAVRPRRRLPRSRSSTRSIKYDTNFQGFGRFLTGSTGEYYFRTIKPVPYSGRPAAHIHFKVWTKNEVRLTTECFVKGYAGNERDGIYRRAMQSKGGKMLPVDFTPVKDSKIGELAAGSISSSGRRRRRE